MWDHQRQPHGRGRLLCEGKRPQVLVSRDLPGKPHLYAKDDVAVSFDDADGLARIRVAEVEQLAERDLRGERGLSDDRDVQEREHSCVGHPDDMPQKGRERVGAA